MSKATELEFLSLETNADGVTIVTFNRPPVNAFSKAVYEDFIRLCDVIEADETTRCAIITSPRDARAFGGGADLNDFLKLDYDSRLERYAIINECFDRLHKLNRPTIAAMNNHAVGVGFVIGTMCDIRLASEVAFFSMPEIDRGVLANGGGAFKRLHVPQGWIREMIYTGKRYMAEELRYAGIFNHILPKEEVLPKAIEIATMIAKKSLPALSANKAAINEGELEADFLKTYKKTQTASATLTAGHDSKEGIRAFLEKRDPNYTDS
jgi:enoyl-CoA hydratase/carnithine racemase